MKGLTDFLRRDGGDREVLVKKSKSEVEVIIFHRSLIEESHIKGYYQIFPFVRKTALKGLDEVLIVVE